MTLIHLFLYGIAAFATVLAMIFFLFGPDAARQFFRRIKKRGAGALAALALIGCLFGLVPTARAQIGTYVLPRPVTLFSGFVTNGFILANGFVFTNFLNYSGYHYPAIWISESATNATLGLGTNLVQLSMDYSPGNGGDYTNSAIGTNLLFTITTPFVWNVLAASTVSVVQSSNLPPTIADSVALIKGTQIKILSTNGFYLQIDGVYTP